MNDRKFALAIFEELLVKNFNQYKVSLNKPLNADSDPYAKARNALARLSGEERGVVIDFLKVVIADSASVILGTLDGVYFPDNLDGDVSVLYDGANIEGDLMDIFIERAQENNVYG